MNNVIINVGISGSGKTTTTTAFLKENPNYLRISRDDIRKTLVGSLDRYYQRKDVNQIERIVNGIEDNLLNDITGREYNLIVDNTNLKQEYVNRWLFFCNRDNFEFKFKLFDCSLEEANERVCKRDFNDEHVSIFEKELKYIEKQFEQYKNIKEYIIKNYGDRIIT